jgi:hypothetical protein
MVEFENIWDLLEPLLEFLDLFNGKTVNSRPRPIEPYVEESHPTFLKWLPSLIDGILVNILFWLVTNRPCSSTKRSLLTRSKSEQFLTGKKRDLGTLMQHALRKCLIAEPAAVWS